MVEEASSHVVNNESGALGYDADRPTMSGYGTIVKAMTPYGVIRWEKLLPSYCMSMRLQYYVTFSA